jgi:hypothetical protein
MAVVLQIINENGADGTTTFRDQSVENHHVSVSGDAQWDTAQAPTGLSASALFDGTGDAFLVTTHPDFGFSTSPFTIEGWARFNVTSGTQNLIDMRTAGGTGVQIVLQASTLRYFAGGAGVLMISTIFTDVSTWFHFALSRANGSSMMFWDGIQIGATTTDSHSFTGQNPVRVGQSNAGTNLLNGWMAAIRINKGEGIYTGNFTPPTLPLTSTVGDTGWLRPTANTIEAGNGTWTNSTNIFVNDGVEAEALLTTKNVDGAWNAGQFFNFDSNIPLGATISTVQVRGDWRVSSAGGIGILEMAAFVSGSSTGVIRDNSLEPTSLTTNTFDITADRGWVRDDLLNSTFELKIRGRNGNSTNNPGYRFDHIAARVLYTASTEASDSIRIRLPAQYDGQGVGGIFFGNRVN